MIVGGLKPEKEKGGFFKLEEGELFLTIFI